MSANPQGPNFKSVVKTEVGNPWGDTSINPDDEYGLYTEEPILLDASGTLNEMLFEVVNHSVEEMCLWGVLTK